MKELGDPIEKIQDYYRTNIRSNSANQLS